MNKQEFLSAQWLSEQLLRVAKCEKNVNGAISPLIDSEASRAYASGLLDRVIDARRRDVALGEQAEVPSTREVL